METMKTLVGWLLITVAITGFTHAEVVDPEDPNALHEAVWADEPLVVEMLLKAGASPEVVDDEGMTPLMVASQIGSVNCASVLLRWKADPGAGNLQDRNKTALIYAVLGGSVETVGYLLDHGAPIEQRDEDAVVPVSWAAYAGELPVLRLLVERGAKLDVVDGFGDDLLAAARNGRRSDNLEYLIHVGAGTPGRSSARSN